MRNTQQEAQLSLGWPIVLRHSRRSMQKLWCIHANRSSPFSRNVADKEISIAASRGLPELTPNVTRSSHGHFTSFLKISCKSVQPFRQNTKRHRQQTTDDRRSTHCADSTLGQKNEQTVLHVIWFDESCVLRARSVKKGQNHPKHLIFALFHGRTRTADLYRCVWSGITGR